MEKWKLKLKSYRITHSRGSLFFFGGLSISLRGLLHINDACRFILIQTQYHWYDRTTACLDEARFLQQCAVI